MVKIKIVREIITKSSEPKKGYGVDDAYDQLSKVIYILTTEEDEIRYRLLKAHKEFIWILDADIPESLKDKWKNIKHNLTKRGEINFPWNMNESAFFHTVKRMRNSTAKKIVIELVSFHYMLKDYTTK